MLQNNEERNINKGGKVEWWMTSFPKLRYFLGLEKIDILKIDCEGCEWSTYKDWIKFGFRQILIETHGVPQPKGGNGRWYKKSMNVTHFYDDFKKHGYALFSTDQNGLGMEMSYIKLTQN